MKLNKFFERNWYRSTDSIKVEYRVKQSVQLLFYVPTLFSSLWLTKCLSERAEIERGYSAFGGEMFVFPTLLILAVLFIKFCGYLYTCYSRKDLDRC